MNGKPVILCVDDEPANLDLLEALLAPSGFHLHRAPGGKEALRVLAERRVDLVLLDVMMLEMDGFETCRQIKSGEKTRHIPVIMLTTLSEKEDRIRGIEAGADDFISKPFDKAEVLARVKMLLRMKDLHDRLNRAYDDIVGLVAFGGNLIRAFEPLTFDFKSSVEAVVGQLLRRRPEDYGKPEAAVVGLRGEHSGWSWNEFRWGGSGLAQRGLHRDPVQAVLREGEVARTHFINSDDMDEPPAGRLREVLRIISADAENAVCYLSPGLCIFFLNYGRPVTAYDASVLDSLVVQSLYLRSLSHQVSETENAFAYTVQALARAAEANDADTGNHILRVGEYCAALAERLGMPAAYVRGIRLQAQMHDVGKIHIHPDILRKKGALDPSEWAEMQKHTLYGAIILGDHPRLKMARNVALTHHEKWDGSGYPSGLKREEIPLEGRLIVIADHYDALRSRREYKEPLDHETTVRLILEGDNRTSPTHFDPRILRAFRETNHRFEQIYEEMSFGDGPTP